MILSLRRRGIRLMASALSLPLCVDDSLVKLSAVFPNLPSGRAQGTLEGHVWTVADVEWWEVKVVNFAVPADVVGPERAVDPDFAITLGRQITADAVPASGISITSNCSALRR